MWNKPRLLSKWFYLLENYSTFFHHKTDIYYRSKVNLVHTCHQIITTLGNYRYLVKFSVSYCLRDVVILESLCPAMLEARNTLGLSVKWASVLFFCFNQLDWVSTTWNERKPKREGFVKMEVAHLHFHCSWCHVSPLSTGTLSPEIGPSHSSISSLANPPPVSEKGRCTDTHVSLSTNL